MKIQTLAVASALLALVPTIALAQTSTNTTKTAPQKPSLMQRLGFGKKPATPANSGKMTASHMGTTGSAGTTAIASGTIVADKKSKVYHLPGDKRLPNINNRVYFKTEAQAQAAGYHKAGVGGKKPGATGAKMTTKMSHPATTTKMAH